VAHNGLRLGLRTLGPSKETLSLTNARSIKG
jgi:hypothetical protein